MVEIILLLLQNLQSQIKNIELANGDEKSKLIKEAYETNARIRYELIRDFNEIQPFYVEDISLNEVDARIEDGMVVLEFDEAIPSYKVDEVAASKKHWQMMVNKALKTLFSKYDKIPYFEKAIVCVEVHKTSSNWDISNILINLVINMLKGNFMPDDNIRHMETYSKGKQSDKEKTIIRICDYNTDINKLK